MTPYFDQGGATLYQGHALSLLRSLPDACAQTCVTSPPYYGLRAYGTEPQVWGGEQECEHKWGEPTPPHHPGQVPQTISPNSTVADGQTATSGATCSLCGAWRGELGLEPTPALFVSHLTEIFREVRRVLADDGTCWVNMGDSYSAGKAGRTDHGTDDPTVGLAGNSRGAVNPGQVIPRSAPPGLAPKNLLGMPWRLAFALQDDGWILRSEIIWHKPNPMPESVRDRPTKAHEQIFLLAKRAAYFYDADAVREDARYGFSLTTRGKFAASVGGQHASHTVIPGDGAGGRNRRTVWTIPPRPFREAHFATFPPALVEPCILAGSRAGDTVLDPFSGAATTGLVALQHGRRYLGLELQPSYLEMSARRLSATFPEAIAA